MEAVGNALTLIAGFLGIWYILHKYVSELKKEISARLDKSEATTKAEVSELKKEISARLDKSEATTKAEVSELKKDISARLDKSEATNKAEHAELTAQVKAQGKDLTDVRVEVGKLSGSTGQQVLEALRRLVGGKDSGGRRD